MSKDHDVILRTESVVKKYGGLVALDNVSIEMKRGEILGLIGPNGAGKTTFFNAVAGSIAVNSGEIWFEGKDITRKKTFERCNLGIARTFQITKPFMRISVLDNVMIGAYFGKKKPFTVGGSKSLQRSREEAMGILEFMGLDRKANALAGTLNVPERKCLELCRALATSPSLLLLDEVIAGLNLSEVDAMVELIRKINSRKISIFMIEHVMKAVMGMSARIIVLNFGKKLTEGSPSEVSANEKVIAAYLGRSGSENAKSRKN